MRYRYLIALGSNMRSRHGSPARTVAAALAGLDVPMLAVSPAVASRPLGPSRRAYVNAAVLIETNMTPPGLLDHLKTLEASFGRRAGGQRWRARVLDLDIIMWSGGMWADDDLSIPHPAFRERAFVLDPLSEVAPDWRDPITGRTIRQLKARLDRRRPSA